VSTLAWVVVGVLAATLLLTVAALAGARARVTLVERRLVDLEARLGDLDARAAHAVQTAQGAAALARRGGTPEPPGTAPRVLLEPVTGRLVKAVAWGAGARRAATRLARSVRSDTR
jgi:hypothetical protein